MKNILFIGGAGFIGSNLIRAINKEKYHVTVVEPEGAYTDRLNDLDLKLIYGAHDNVLIFMEGK